MFGQQILKNYRDNNTGGVAASGVFGAGSMAKFIGDKEGETKDTTSSYNMPLSVNNNASNLTSFQSPKQMPAFLGGHKKTGSTSGASMKSGPGGESTASMDESSNN